jgi:TatD DNase family protein
MIDSHCHLTDPRFSADREAVLERARQAGLAACVTIGTGCADARAARELARAAPGFVHCSAGLDPFSAHALGSAFAAGLAELRVLLSEGGFVALGEVGLDYHYDLSPRRVQGEQLAAQLGLAEELGLPVVIHVREAHVELALALEAFPRVRGVIHSFTGGPAAAERYLALGWSLAFNGIVTFPKAEEVRAAAALVPADRLLVETDSPYLAPVPRRGQRCEPADVVQVLARLAALRLVTVEALAATTGENARRLFRLPLSPPAGDAVVRPAV